jgi:transposase
MLKKLHRAIQTKRLGMLTSGVVLLHDNVHPHRAAGTQALPEHFNWELFYYPPYSPELATSNYHLITHLKNWLGSQYFNNNEKLIEGVKTFEVTITKNTSYLISVYQGSPLEERQRYSQTLKKVSRRKPLILKCFPWPVFAYHQ